MTPDDPYLRDLLLIGGGHAHVQVLRRFGMKPEPGVRLTLVSRESESPYTGMLPGFIAGEYERSQIVIDLLKLSRFAHCRFIEANVEAVDVASRQVHLTGDRPPLRFDVLSINSGGDSTLEIPGAEFVVPVKPIGRFLQYWQSSVGELAKAQESTVAVIGGGPGGVEFAIAMRHRLGNSVSIKLLVRNEELLQDHGRRVRSEILAALATADIEVLYSFDVTKVERALGSFPQILTVHSGNGEAIRCDRVFSAVGVNAPAWLRDSGFAVDDDGFLKVNRHLQAIDVDYVFGAGDAVSLSGQTRPKSGVYAVREGPTLGSNLRQHLIGRRLETFRAQRKALALIRSEPGAAIASRGLIQGSGKWLWRYKDWIDRRFMQRFQDLPVMPIEAPSYQGALNAVAPEPTMRCGGCGAKLGADLLQRVLHRLDIHQSEEVHLGIGEDAAVVNFGTATLAMSCDGFRAMIDDPWRFGRIAAHHALNDLYAMNSEPNVALALVTVPFMADELMEEDLFQLMSGSLSVFNECNVSLVGGHTAEGAELSVGFSVLGSASFHVMAKGNLKPGQALILTKPLGTGTILAGAMDGRCSAGAVERAYDVMDKSNASAMRVLSDLGAVACTDVTGFGLAGHLSEMLRASHASATIDLDRVPVLPEALDAIARGVVSSIQLNNEKVFNDCVYDCSSLDPRLRALADPQTSGGLLVGFDADYVANCVEELRKNGYPGARVIGSVDAETTQIGRMTVLS